MKVMVTGATGFVGRHVVTQLLARGHAVVAIARDIERARKMPWFENVEFIQCDLHKNYQSIFKAGSLPDVLVHLAWPGMARYPVAARLSVVVTLRCFPLMRASPHPLHWLPNPRS